MNLSFFISNVSIVFQILQLLFQKKINTRITSALSKHDVTSRQDPNLLANVFHSSSASIFAIILALSTGLFLVSEDLGYDVSRIFSKLTFITIQLI